MVETLRRYAERAGFTVEGAAPTNKAAAELASAVPRPAPSPASCSRMLRATRSAPSSWSTRLG
nr:hypothetical protein [Cereibacter sphaeroides]